MNFKIDFLIACRDGNLSEVTRLHAIGTYEDLLCDRELNTGLSWSAVNGHLDVFKFLIRKFADVSYLYDREARAWNKKIHSNIRPYLKYIEDRGVSGLRSLLEDGIYKRHQNEHND